MWAFDAVTYYWLEQLLQEKFYVVKWAVGGTSIAPDYNASKGRFGLRRLNGWHRLSQLLMEETPCCFLSFKR